MSDPVTNVQIEDVLSSIRRLVSEGEKPREKKSAPAKAASAPRGTVEKFVLTPALRVADVPHRTNDSPAVNTPTASQKDDSGLPSMEKLFDPEAEVALPDGDTALLLFDQQSPVDRASLKATIAELEAAVTTQPDEWEPDGSELNGPVPSWETTGFTGTEGVEDAEPVVDCVSKPASQIDEATPLPDAPHVTASFNEPTFRHTPQDESDTDFGDELRGGDDLDDDLDAFLAKESALMLDEDALRQMVADIVKQELQGAMGERITRNVRKLVRSEIHRMIASQDFEG